jgi:hypothetical protein
VDKGVAAGEILGLWWVCGSDGFRVLVILGPGRPAILGPLCLRGFVSGCSGCGETRVKEA